ncbi:amino acid ABC transporter permease [Clostridium sp.]|uniref:amino acid ABC transporter permease n=1 Tax=Clostridium sp. TaxID=1506 RepID=UPI002842C895|nr:amino acid ABC transporter permease [Clostridium sp.]MDR3595707.1 amino acid ABC transporter permease [Clostridium sp.]
MGKLFDFKLIFEYLPSILARIHITLLIVLLATIVGLLLGVFIALARIYKIPVINQLTIIYISFIRGTPIIVQLFIVYYGLPEILIGIGININRWDKLNFVLVTYALNSAAFMAEIIRASITSVPIGQTEAAYSIGMTRWQAFYRIIAPQAIITSLPSLGTSIIGLLQDTSLAYTLGIIDMMGQAQAIGARTLHTIEGYIGATIIFIVLSILLEKVFSIIEKKVTFEKIIGDGR